MSAESQQQEIQGEDGQRRPAGIVTTTIRKIFVDPNPHFLILILCNYTLDQLINFRCSCKEFNAFVLLYQGSIVGGVFKQMAYRTAIKLYCGPILPRGLTFNNLVDMTRRCSIAREVAQLLTRKRLMDAGSLRRGSPNARRRVVFHTARVASNAYPYILALLQFFEEFRFRLGSISLDETALLRPTIKSKGSSWRRRKYLEYFTFAGLETFKSVVYDHVRRASIMLDNYSRSTWIHPSITTYNGLSPGALFSRYGTMIPRPDGFGETSTGLIRPLMPRAEDILNLEQHGRHPGRTQAAFLKWLMRYRGEEPVLLR